MLEKENCCLFSILMCTKNSGKTLEKAISSVMEQNCQNWELIILDNGSEDNSWEIIENAKRDDARIKGIHLDENIGWAKGASKCLDYADGKYMTFLAADDFLLNNGCLSAIEKCIRTEEPDIVWVGHASVQLLENGYNFAGGGIPKYKVYYDWDKIEEICEIMNTLYYNSFFHYIRISLLKENGIDFYYPFYGDCEGVTEAMCRSRKAVVLDQAVYALTLNTSQTAGGVAWRYHVIQWQSIMNAVKERGKYSYNKLRYIAVRILNNNMARIRAICDSSRELRDEEMNPVCKTCLEKFQYLETALATIEFTEMFYYAGRKRYAAELMECMKILYEECLRTGYSEQEIAENVQWASDLVQGIYMRKHQKLIRREMLDRSSLEFIQKALCQEENTGMFGYELIMGENFAANSGMQEIWGKVEGSYINWNLKMIYRLLFLATEIKKRGRMDEVAEILKECMYILEQIKCFISEEQLEQVAEDLSMTIDAKI